MAEKEAKQLIDGIISRTERKIGHGEEVIVTVGQQAAAIALNNKIGQPTTRIIGVSNPGQSYPNMFPWLPGLDGAV